jgi:hypothetical protein
MKRMAPVEFSLIMLRKGLSALKMGVESPDEIVCGSFPGREPQPSR